MHRLDDMNRGIVRLYKERFGRGPTRVRSEFAGPDAIVCSVAETLTPAERTLVERGQRDRVRDTRTWLQYASDREFRALAEEVTGRKVRAFVSGVDVDNDLAAEVFFFEPAATIAQRWEAPEAVELRP